MKANDVVGCGPGEGRRAFGHIESAHFIVTKSVACFVAALSAVGAYLWRQTATPAQPRVVVGAATDPREETDRDETVDQPDAPEATTSTNVVPTPPGKPSTAHADLPSSQARSWDADAS